MVDLLQPFPMMVADGQSMAAQDRIEGPTAERCSALEAGQLCGHWARRWLVVWCGLRGTVRHADVALRFDAESPKIRRIKTIIIVIYVYIISYPPNS